MNPELSLFDAMYNCRAMRRLSSEVVPEEQLLRLIESAEQAASGGNTQRRRWIIVRDAERKASLAALNRAVSEELVRSRIDRGEALPHHGKEKRGRMLKSVLWLAENSGRVSTRSSLRVTSLMHRPRRKTGARVQSSVFPAVQNLLLAARGLGLGAVLTTYALNRYDEFVKVINLPENFAAYALIPVGYPLRGNLGP